MAKLTTYAITTHVRLANGSWTARQVDAIVAATSQRAAAKAVGVSVAFLKKYGSATGNARDIAKATSEPGILFVRPAGTSMPDEPYMRVDPRP